MPYADIIKRAWYLTVKHNYLIKFGMLFAVFSSVGMLVSYALRWHKLILRFFSFEEIVLSFSGILGSISSLPSWVTFIIIFIIGFAVYLFVPAFFEASLIGSINLFIKDENVKVRLGETIAMGVDNYPRYLELRALSVLTGKAWMVLLVIDMINTYLGTETLKGLAVPLLIILIVIQTVEFGIMYAKFHIIIKEDTVFGGVARSLRMLIFFLKESIVMTVILSLIGFVTLINMFIIFLLPILIFSLTTLLAAYVAPSVSLWIGGIIFIFLAYIVVKIQSYVICFNLATWTLTYLYLDQRMTEHYKRDKLDETTDIKVKQQL